MHMPDAVLEQIRDSVRSTMESETRTLKEELGKTTEILVQMPSTLNTYVE